VPHSLGEIIAE